MGCTSSRIKEESKTRKGNNHNKLFPNYQYEYDLKKFPDMEETTRKGIKEIPSYKCDLPYDKLNELREKFWESRKSNKTLWKIIKECCETDSETAVLLLEAAGMACHKNLRNVFLLHTPDFIFRVPNYCICDPLFERDYDILKNKFKDVNENKIVIVLSYLDKNKNVKLNVTNKMKVKDVKKMFAENIGIDDEKCKIRFLFKGQELIDDNLLCYNNVENMSKIHVMVNQIE